MTPEEFERVLEEAVIRLNGDVRGSTQYHAPDLFERRVFDVLSVISAASGNITVNPTFHPHAFPDIKANGFGVEVKTTNKDSWLSVGNSVFEGMRDPSVKRIYVVFGKMGGAPAVKWGRYEEIITHVRISHAPRFVLEMDRNSPLFKHPAIGIDYDTFCMLAPSEKMKHIRDYSRARLGPGEQLWWLEEDEGDQGVELEVKLYRKLSPARKIELRAEGAILFPQICGGSRDRDKYNRVAFFLLQHRSVFCPQARDLFSAGSVAGEMRGGNYLQRALVNIQDPMRLAAARLEPALFQEHWGFPPPAVTKDRLLEWLRLADGYAKDWKPSDYLFWDEQGKNP
jgi:hypothetical protein